MWHWKASGERESAPGELLESAPSSDSHTHCGPAPRHLLSSGPSLPSKGSVLSSEPTAQSQPDLPYQSVPVRKGGGHYSSELKGERLGDRFFLRGSCFAGMETDACKATEQSDVGFRSVLVHTTVSL